MNVAIVDDDQRFSESLSLEFKEDGFDVHTYASVSDFMKNSGSWSYIVLDLKLGTEISTDFVAQIRNLNSESKIVILTGYGSISSTVEAIKNGADDYLTKPISYETLKAKLLGESIKVEEENSAMSLDRAQREYLEFILKECGGNISMAARKLGIHRQSLQRKLKKYTPN